LYSTYVVKWQVWLGKKVEEHVLQAEGKLKKYD
jgi:hypothetical protein